METMGLTTAEEGDQYRTLTERGEKLAEAYQELIDAFEVREFLDQGAVAREKLQPLGDTLCLCEVCTPDAPDRDRLRDVYIPPESTDPSRVNDSLRAQSLQILLTLTNQLDDGTAFTSTALVDACYYGTIETAGGYQPVRIPDHLSAHAARWGALRAHDYFGYATEAVLEGWLAFIDAQPQTDATIEQFQNRVIASDVCEQLSTQLDR
jgi:hypothetical protein